MEAELLTLLLEYKNKLFDDSFIYECANILYNEKDYTSVFKEIKLYDKIDEDRDALACFIREDDELAVSMEDMERETKDIFEFIENSSEEEKIFLVNTSIMATLLHEFVHVDQELLELDECDNSFEKILISYVDAFLLLSEDNEYSSYLIKNGFDPLELSRLCDYMYKKSSNYYLVSPTERLAQLKAYKKLFSIIRPIKQEHEISYNFHVREYFWEYLNGYDVVSDGMVQGPTSKYFQDMELDIFFDLIHEYLLNNRSILTYENRLLYGLELKEEEANILAKRYLDINEKCKTLGIM